MKTKLLLLCGLFVAVLAIGTVRAHAAEPQKEDAAFNAKLLDAIKNDDYASFVADGTAAFQGLPKVQFDAVSAQLAPKLKEAHTVTFLGELNQRGFRVTLWKLAYSDGSDDALISLSVKDGKVGGYWVK
jgi:hypothetical protein